MAISQGGAVMDEKDDRIRVVTLLTEEEKEWLQHLAWKSGRSMSGYLRYLLIKDIEKNMD
jgi:hypothetical protein